MIRLEPGRSFWVGVILLLSSASYAGREAVGAGPDVYEPAAGRRVEGRFEGTRETGFNVVGEGGKLLAVDGVGKLLLGTGEAKDGAAGVPPLQVLLGLDQRISGQLRGLDRTAVRLEGGPGGRDVEIRRSGAIGIRQRPGESLVLIEGFESLDGSRWNGVGTPRLEDGTKLSGERSLRLEPDGTAITTRLAEPVGRGRFEMAFRDGGAVAARSDWMVDFLFRGEGGPETIKAILGWSEESLAVQSSGGRFSLAVQRLARKPGWHRLELRFGPDAAELAVDGDSLAHGKGPSGPLVEIRIGSAVRGLVARPASGAFAFVDDLRLVRFATGLSTDEVDPGQDEVRLVGGDQVFGSLARGDSSGVEVEVFGKLVSLPWTHVAAVRFRADPRPSRVVEGLLTRLEWRSAPGDDPKDVDAVEGALVAADAASFAIETPYAGRVSVPRDRVVRATFDGLGSRIVIDPTAHHMGDEVARAPNRLDPPQPEGGTLERAFSIDRVPEPGESARLVIDVVQVVGEANGLQYSHLVRMGELRTKLSLNGREFDYINRYVLTPNDLPERIRVPIPEGLLKAGENRLKIVQYGKADDPNYLDDLGILGIAFDLIAKPKPGTP